MMTTVAAMTMDLREELLMTEDHLATMILTWTDGLLTPGTIMVTGAGITEAAVLEGLRPGIGILFAASLLKT